MGLDRPQPRLENGVDVLRRHAEHRDTHIVDQIEESLRTWMERVAVEKDDRGPSGQTRDEPVPHHPSASREKEETIPGPNVEMMPLFLHVLEQDSAGHVHHALGLAGGP